jgi:DNA modification methylase
MQSERSFPVSELAALVDSVPVDDSTIVQSALDVCTRDRTSLYPWRGQFSPQLVETLLSEYGELACTILDPFVGSGTTLFEAANRQLSAVGVEVNLAAVLFANMAHFAQISDPMRDAVVEDAGEIINGLTRYVESPLPCSAPAGAATAFQADLASLSMALVEAESQPMLHDFLATTVMLAMKNGKALEARELQRAFRKNAEIVKQLPASEEKIEAVLGDARDLALKPDTVDLVLTSPPYINVFNYHQNYRPALELMGWEPLTVARSEIGSNRKHRSNRFLTVIQYCIDMALSLKEMRRVLKKSGIVILVVGHESRVRGVPFYNGTLIGTVAIAGLGFKLEKRHVRSFKNRFGQRIQEEILVLAVDNEGDIDLACLGRAVGTWALETTLRRTADLEPLIRNDLEIAINSSNDVSASPMMRPQQISRLAAAA